MVKGEATVGMCVELIQWSSGSLVGVGWGVGMALSTFLGRTHPKKERPSCDAFAHVKMS